MTVFPQEAIVALNQYATVLSRSISSEALIVNPWSDLWQGLPGYLSLQLFQVIIVPIFLLVYVRLQRDKEITTDWSKHHWLNVLALSMILITLFLTPVSDFLGGNVAVLFSSGRVISYMLGGLLCIGIWYGNKQ